jgi:VWFA-related protein
MPNRLSFVFLFSCLMTAVAAQDQAPTFRSRADLVTIPVVVTRDGKPVRGLKKEDFQLFHNGKPESVAVFEEIGDRSSVASQAHPPANTVQNYVPISSQDVVILVLDFTIDEDQWVNDNNIRTSLAAIAQQFAADNTPVSVLVMSRQGLVQIHSFTSSPADLTKSVDMFVRRRFSKEVTLTTREESDNRALQSPGPYLEQVRLLDLRLRSEAVRDIARSYRGLPGRKKLIWMSTRFVSVSGGVPHDKDWFGPFYDAEARESSLQALSDANIAVYPLDTRGVTNPSWNDHFAAENNGGDRYERFFGLAKTRDPGMINTLGLLEASKRTGGQNCTDLPLQCVKRVQEDGNEYYVLGFYLPKGAKPGWHSLKVESTVNDLSIRARSGFQVAAKPGIFTGPPRPAAVKNVSTLINSPASSQPQFVPVGDEVLTALAAPLDYSSIPLRLTWAASGTGESRQVELLLKSPPGGILVRHEDSLLNVDLLAFIRPSGDPQGKSFPESLVRKLSPQDQERLASSGFAYRTLVHIHPGRYGIRVLVRDNTTGNIGTVSALMVVH